MKVGFIGVGIMGSGMARNLLKAGYDVTVYNRTRSKAESLSSEGANIADEPVDVAKISDILITVLEGDKSVEEVLFNGGIDLISNLPENAIHISMETISVNYSRLLNKNHKKKVRVLLLHRL